MRAHGLRRQAGGVDAADRDLGLGEAFAAVGVETPVRQPPRHLLEPAVGDGGELAPQPDPLGQRLGEPLRQRFGEDVVEVGARPLALGPDEPVRWPVGEEVQPDLFARPPVGGDLQDRRPGEAPVGEQGRLAEAGLAGAGDHLGRDARQGAEQGFLLA